MIVLPESAAPRVDVRAVAYIYGISEDPGDGRAEVHYTAWQMIPAGTSIPRGHYPKLAKVELADKAIREWHFCREMLQRDIEDLLRFRGGVLRRQTFVLEEHGGWLVPCFVRSHQHIGVLLDGRRRFCVAPSRARIFTAFKSVRMEAIVHA